MIEYPTNLGVSVYPVLGLLLHTITMTLTLLMSLGIVHLILILIGCILFLILLGVCCWAWDEPYPRVVQYAYPSSSENRWWLMHVSRTALRKEWYVSSISQFVGARGTTGSKLMLLLTTTLSLSSAYITAVMWCERACPLSTLVLTVLASLGLGLLGFVESSLEWTPLPLDYPDLESGEDQNRMNAFYSKLEITRLTGEDDAWIKAQFSNLHMCAAFLFVLAQFAAQVCRYVWGGSTVRGADTGLAFASVGLGLFLVFCVLQWVSGANDDMLEGSNCSCLRARDMPDWLRLCYCPQGAAYSPRQLKRISWSFIGVELASFVSLASCVGWAAALS